MSIHWEGARRNSATLKKDVAAEARSTCLESCVERRSRSSYVVQAARLKKKTPDAKKGQDLGGMTVSASCDFFLSGLGWGWNGNSCLGSKDGTSLPVGVQAQKHFTKCCEQGSTPGELIKILISIL